METAETYDESGRISGKPTLLVTFDSRLDGAAVLSAVTSTGYPEADVKVYHRLQGTDQVLDGITGQVPAGEALSREASAGKVGLKFDTLVLMHPDAGQFIAVKEALARFGAADFKYAEANVYEGRGL